MSCDNSRQIVWWRWWWNYKIGFYSPHHVGVCFWFRYTRGLTETVWSAFTFLERLQLLCWYDFSRFSRRHPLRARQRRRQQSLGRPTSSPVLDRLLQHLPTAAQHRRRVVDWRRRGSGQARTVLHRPPFHFTESGLRRATVRRKTASLHRQEDKNVAVRPLNNLKISMSSHRPTVSLPVVSAKCIFTSLTRRYSVEPTRWPF